MTSFVALGVPKQLSAVLAKQGINEPFPIQVDTLPDSLQGRNVLGRGRTGSGKTLAFSLPMVTRLAFHSTGRRSDRRPRGLILAPTRELATQIAEAISPLARSLELSVVTVFGGVSQGYQTKAIRSGVDIVVACPGRLEDLIKQGELSLDNIEVTVVDEADHMADLGFLPSVTRILAATPNHGQRMLFSATLDGDIDSLVRRFLPDAVKHEAEDAEVSSGVMTHRVFQVNSQEDKNALVQHLASGEGKRIMFTRTKHHAMRLAKQLTAAGIPAVDLHGNLQQRARDRNLKIFSTPFAQGGVRVLVATDVAARGVHVDDVELVVHVDPPAEHKAYLHRSGRTARAGASGTVVTITLPAQRKDLVSVLRRAEINAPIERTAAHTHEVSTLVGTRAAIGERKPFKDDSRTFERGERGPGRPGRRQTRPAGDSGGASAGRPARSSRPGKSYGSSSAPVNRDRSFTGERPAWSTDRNSERSSDRTGDRTSDRNSADSASRRAPRHGAPYARSTGGQEQRPQGQTRGRSQSRQRPATNGGARNNSPLR
jgi:superfamily II DNA/RNA helicase